MLDFGKAFHGERGLKLLCHKGLSPWTLLGVGVRGLGRLDEYAASYFGLGSTLTKVMNPKPESTTVDDINPALAEEP